MTLETFILLLWLKHCAAFYGVEPEFVKAVADVECNTTQGFLIGPIDKKGRFIGPMGIHKDYANTYPIYNPFVNIALGARALGRYKNKVKALRKYNTSFNAGYYKAIKRRYNYYKRSGLN